MRIWLKMVLVAVMTLVILIPLAMVNAVITERQAYRREAVADVVRAYAGAQAVTGPVVTVPYSELVDVEETGRDGVVRTVRKRQASQWTFFPSRFDADGAIVPSIRKRGLYEVAVYEWAGELSADFDIRIPDVAPAGAQRLIGTPVLGYAISDVRGLQGSPRLRLAGADVALREGAGVREGSGVHALLALPQPGERMTFSTRLDVQLAGTESLAIVPIGKRNRIALSSRWPHPSFQGKSPWRSDVSDKGFRAEWRIASVATDAQRRYLAGASALPFGDAARVEAAGSDGSLERLGVVLADPVDAYTRADRATKYGVLFVVLTFLGFFMFEAVKQVPIHPIQYGLVGLALVIFFLLLVSLSEHVGFDAAYVAASLACLGLIGFYLGAVLRSTLRGAAFAAMLALLYAALYGLLVSEDSALMLGSGLLFAILAGIMIVTRHYDWYRLGGASAATRPS
ncbi:MAG TPA: cell envelope integrity protein CreD [Lysobacter sp.]|nr:cell envelope integrity protein CreD [Lysobacter sp.]